VAAAISGFYHRPITAGLGDAGDQKLGDQESGRGHLRELDFSFSQKLKFDF